MNRTEFLLVMVALAALVFLGMWLGWRARNRRGASVRVSRDAPGGERIASFAQVGYVSTTPEARPLERVVIPGLGYKGFADVAVSTGGVLIAVTGEEPVGIPAGDLRGVSTAQGRVGKAVERDGLSVLHWIARDSEHRDLPLESGFRFSAPQEQFDFAAAVGRLTAGSTSHHHTQEEA